MLRFLAVEVDIGAAANVGGPVHTEYKSFTDAAKLEAWMRYADNNGERKKWATRSAIGIELMDESPDPAAAHGRALVGEAE